MPPSQERRLATMKLTWSQAQNGNWNGKRGPFTLMVVAFHDDGGGVWMVHSKLPGVRTVLEFLGPGAAQEVADGLFAEWVKETNLKGKV